MIGSGRNRLRSINGTCELIHLSYWATFTCAVPGQVQYHVIVITGTTRLRVTFALFGFISCDLLSERKTSLKKRRDLHNRTLSEIIRLVSFMFPFSPLTKSVSWIYLQRECLSCSSEKKLNHGSHLIRVVLNKCISFFNGFEFPRESVHAGFTVKI